MGNIYYVVLKFLNRFTRNVTYILTELYGPESTFQLSRIRCCSGSDEDKRRTNTRGLVSVQSKVSPSKGKQGEGGHLSSEGIGLSSELACVRAYVRTPRRRRHNIYCEILTSPQIRVMSHDALARKRVSRAVVDLWDAECRTTRAGGCCSTSEQQIL